MWKEYSVGYIKKNRTSSFSVMIAAFISALLLSLLCGPCYNTWKYEVERIELEAGSWQSRITGEIKEEELESIRNYASVKKVSINKKETQGGKIVLELSFHDMKSVLEDTPRIAESIGISEESATYNYELLAMHFIRIPQDTAPRLLFPLFVMILIMASFSLIVIIHNSFAVSMNARIHQFGIFSSIGATPKQIRACQLQEAAALCTAIDIVCDDHYNLDFSMASGTKIK